MRRLRFSPPFGLAAALLLVVAACGGNGGASGTPPTGLSYPQSSVLLLDQPMTPLSPQVSGQVSSYSVSPALPAGLTLNQTSGVISGTPTAVASQAAYTVTALGPLGSTSANVSITVVSAAIAYPSSYYAYTAGVNSEALTPTSMGISFTNWTVTPALPAGLTLSPGDGTISGIPTSPSPPTSYVITASSPEGNETTTLTIAVAATPLLDLGLASAVVKMRYVNSSLLSQDNTDQWLLQDVATGATLASGDGAGAVLRNGGASYVDLENDVMIDQVSAGLEVRSATDGDLIATIANPPQVSWYLLASDGSYIAAGSPTALMAWSTSGQLLFSNAGDYSQAAAFAAPGQIQVAMGPAGANVIETVAVPAGSSVVSPSFQGVFNTWFLDGAHFLTNQGNTVWTYTSAATQVQIFSLPSVVGLAGIGNWFWTTQPELNIYQANGNGTPVYSLAAAVVVPSGTTLGTFTPAGELTTAITIVDLSGATPVATSYSGLPFAPVAYGATSPTQWLIGDPYGVVYDGTSLGGTPRTLTLGSAWSIAAGTSFVSVATASGKIFVYNASDDSLVATLDFLSSDLSASTDGSVLAAAADMLDAQFRTDRSINIYSLPSGTLTNSFSYSYPNTDLTGMTLSGSGSVLGETFAAPTMTNPCTNQVITVTDGTAIVCNIPGTPVLSPNGMLVASSPAESATASSNIYSNGTLVTAVTGQALGWIDDNRLLVQTYINPPQSNPLLLEGNGTIIFDAAGNELGTTPFLGLFPFQVVSAANGTIYQIETNTILSLTSGATVWASASLAASGTYPRDLGGGVTSQQVVFAAGSLVLAQPY